MVGEDHSILVLQQRYLSPEQEIKHAKMWQYLFSVLLKANLAEQCHVKNVGFALGTRLMSNIICWQ